MFEKLRAIINIMRAKQYFSITEHGISAAYVANSNVAIIRRFAEMCEEMKMADSAVVEAERIKKGKNV